MLPGLAPSGKRIDQVSTKAWRFALWREQVIEWTRRFILPNANAAEVPEIKIVGYLLSATHTAGKSKAAFFGKHGFVAANWQALARALRGACDEESGPAN